MGKIFQPQASVKLTNVSIVKLKLKGKRFEVACYKNKVVEYRNGIEKDLDNVLQIHSVFTNVSKGQLSPIEDLKLAFNTTNIDVVIQFILEKGDLQINEKERQQQIGMFKKEIVTIIVSKTINPTTGKPYPSIMIEQVLKDIPFVYNLTRNPKQLALELIPKIRLKIPIERVLMKIQLEFTKEFNESLMIQLKDFILIENINNNDDKVTVVGKIEPGKYKELVNLVQKECGASGIIQVLSDDVE